jgi:hypothetical protein
MIATQFSTEEQVLVTIKPVDVAGKPAKLDGVPKWQILTPGSGVTLAPAADGLSCAIISGDEVEEGVIVQVDGDADLGEGIVDLQEQFSVSVIHANATSLGATIAAPTVKTGPGPVVAPPVTVADNTGLGKVS